jgi:branched-chain amino acid transport system ATP-binding protein
MPLQPLAEKPGPLVIKGFSGKVFYVPSTLATIKWGYLPNATDAPVLTVPSGATVVFDTLSHEGILEDQGRNPVQYFGSHGVPPHQRARVGVGYVSESRDVFPRLSVRHNLLLGEQPGQRHRPHALDDALALFPALARRINTPAGVLSGGEQQMLALARCWMGQPRLMLIDEPTEGLAPQVVAQLAQALRHFQAQGVAVLLIEQKRQLALTVASRCAVMGHGRLVFDGTPDQLLADEALQREWLAV